MFDCSPSLLCSVTDSSVIISGSCSMPFSSGTPLHLSSSSSSNSSSSSSSKTWRKKNRGKERREERGEKESREERGGEREGIDRACVKLSSKLKRMNTGQHAPQAIWQSPISYRPPEVPKLHSRHANMTVILQHWYTHILVSIVHIHLEEKPLPSTPPPPPPFLFACNTYLHGSLCSASVFFTKNVFFSFTVHM